MGIAAFVVVLTLVALMATVLSERSRKRKRVSKPQPVWTVRVVNATQARYYHSDYDRDGLPVEDAMAVRLSRGKDELTIATIKVTEEDFDEQMAAAIGRAEERATSLNAVCEETN